MSDQRFTNGGNGDGAVLRDSGGRFIRGTRGGPGSPHVRKIARLRSALLGAVTPADIREVVVKLIELAKSGSVPAAKELLDRTVGSVGEIELREFIAELRAEYGLEQR